MAMSCGVLVRPELLKEAEAFVVPRAKEPFRVVVAMSGGVDSSVAAWLLKEAGHEVIGVSLRLAPEPEGASKAVKGRCCSVDDMADARQVCDKLEIPFYAIDSRERFKETVFDPFVKAYRAGQTPIPCLACNHEVKFGDLYKTAQSLGARLATGHYVQMVEWKGQKAIARPEDHLKDQTYYLYGMHPEIVPNLEFPLGGLHKPFVRALAHRMGLRVSNKPDSHEICFVPDGNHAKVVERALGPLPKGMVHDVKGQVLGEHAGIHHFTIGQRKGLGFGTGQKTYVVDIDPKSHGITVGSAKDLECHILQVTKVNALLPVSLWPEEVMVQIRARHQPRPAQVHRLENGDWRIQFVTPATAAALGQAAVIYADNVLLGGGIIQARLDGQNPRQALPI